MKFHSSPDPTIGVEIELQLVDDNTLDLKNISPRVLAEMDKNSYFFHKSLSVFVL